MGETVENNLAALQQITRDAQERSFRHLKQYVWNRERAFTALARLDPDSKPARDARDRLDKARADYEAHTSAIAPEVPVNTHSEAQAGQSADNQSDAVSVDCVPDTTNDFDTFQTIDEAQNNAPEKQE